MIEKVKMVHGQRRWFTQSKGRQKHTFIKHITIFLNKRVLQSHIGSSIGRTSPSSLQNQSKTLYSLHLKCHRNLQQGQINKTGKIVQLGKEKHS
ncbi:hypothetical protein YC2023_008265 [Brassica napus]